MTQEATDETFEKLVLKNEKPTLVYFSAPWCVPCRKVGPIIDEIADSGLQNLDIVKVNIEEATNTALANNISGVPVISVYHNGEIQKTVRNFRSKAAILKEIGEYTS